MPTRLGDIVRASLFACFRQLQSRTRSTKRTSLKYQVHPREPRQGLICYSLGHEPSNKDIISIVCVLHAM